jgi:hypothetical protein
MQIAMIYGTILLTLVDAFSKTSFNLSGHTLRAL